MDGDEHPHGEAKKRRRPTPQELAQGLVTLLDVEEIDVDLYRGPRNPGGRGRVFGGQVIAQALMSAVGSVEAEREVHSLHAYFMRPGDEDFPIIYRVERDYDGGSFSNRRVIAMQRGKPILNMTASFQRKEKGWSTRSKCRTCRHRTTCPRKRKSSALQGRDPGTALQIPHPFAADRDPAGRDLEPGQSGQARAGAQSVDPRLRPDRREPADAPGRARLRVGHGPPVDLHAAARGELDDAQDAVRQPRSCPVVP